MKILSQGGSVPKNLDRYSKWKWSSNMTFLKDFSDFSWDDTTIERSRRHSSPSIKEDEEDEDDSMSSESSSLPLSELNKRTRNDQDEQESGINKIISLLNSKPELSSTEHIMIGYANTIDTFSARRKIVTKMKIAKIIMEAELEEEQERNQQLHHNCSSSSDHSEQQTVFVNQYDTSVSPHELKQELPDE